MGKASESTPLIQQARLSSEFGQLKMPPSLERFSDILSYSDFRQILMETNPKSRFDEDRILNIYFIMLHIIGLTFFKWHEEPKQKQLDKVLLHVKCLEAAIAALPQNFHHIFEVPNAYVREISKKYYDNIPIDGDYLQDGSTVLPKNCGVAQIGGNRKLVNILDQPYSKYIAQQCAIFGSSSSRRGGKTNHKKTLVYKYLCGLFFILYKKEVSSSANSPTLRFISSICEKVELSSAEHGVDKALYEGWSVPDPTEKFDWAISYAGDAENRKERCREWADSLLESFQSFHPNLPCPGFDPVKGSK
jgi:hypothetical protein